MAQTVTPPVSDLPQQRFATKPNPLISLGLKAVAQPLLYALYALAALHSQ
jgi:hypothetical protein